MFSEKKMEVYEDKYGLSIRFSWFTPKAFFLMFFCFVWDSFLFFWYSSLVGTGTPWLFYIFPLIHVALGLYLTYYTACLFFNKTYIDVDDQHLWIHHTPIPWWRGNADLPVDEIAQIFVKEKRENDNQSSEYSYSLFAKLKNGSTKKILDIGITDSQKALELEEVIENYLGIQDMPVKGEYGKTRQLEDLSILKKKKRKIRAGALELLYKEERDDVLFDGAYYEVGQVRQYDWKDGNSDKLLQLIQEKEQQTLVYIHQNKGIYKTYLEEELNYQQSKPIGFSVNNPLDEIQFQGVIYELYSYNEGDLFVGESAEPLATKQWLYRSKDAKKHLRIINNSNILTYYKGIQKIIDSIPLDDQDFLDLNQTPKEKIKRWNDEDFV